MKITTQIFHNEEEAKAFILSVRANGAHVRRTQTSDGPVKVQYTYYNDHFIGKSIKVLKHTSLVQETEESNGERTHTTTGTELVITRKDCSNKIFVAVNQKANEQDFEKIGNLRYPVNKRPFYIGWTELIDLVDRNIVKIT